MRPIGFSLASDMNDVSLLMTVRAALRTVPAPKGGDLVTSGAIEGLTASADGVVRFTLNTDRSGGDAGLLDAARAAAAATPGVSRVAAVATAHRTAAPPAPSHGDPLRLSRPPQIEAAARSLAGVRNVIAVASGKGGVGKSTVAANLAVAFARAGLKTGLLDADIYGPSLPTLFALTGKPAMREGKIIPVEKFGVRAMSIGLLVDAEKALAWRGPMVMGAVRQLVGDVDWGELDVLVIDTPPGTGDAHLSLVQSKRLTGVVIVSTPQEMALADMRRGAELFRSAGVPIIGVIENMAWLEAGDGGRTYLFGKGGAEKAAAELGVPFLGPLPIHTDLRIASDEGEPIGIRAPQSKAAQDLDALALKIRVMLS
ncbi:MAG: P-loop NTPase [Parvularculaceae bacterium]